MAMPTTVRWLTTYAKRLLYSLGRWLDRNVSPDRWLAIISIAAAIIFGIPGIIGIVELKLLTPTLVTILLLTFVTSAILIAALRLTSVPMQRLHRFPYRIKERITTANIVDDDGREAILHEEEEIVSLQDHLIAIWRLYWGAGEEAVKLSDLVCEAPADAVVADRFSEQHKIAVLDFTAPDLQLS
jgi:hypothetical protein